MKYQRIMQVVALEAQDNGVQVIAQSTYPYEPVDSVTFVVGDDKAPKIRDEIRITIDNGRDDVGLGVKQDSHP